MIDYGTAPQPRFVVIRSKRPGRYLILVDDSFPEAERLEEMKLAFREHRQSKDERKWQDYSTEEVGLYLEYTACWLPKEQ